MQVAIRSQLMRHEVAIPSVDVMFLYQMLSGIGEIADSAEKVAHRAQICHLCSKPCRPGPLS